MRLGDDEHMYFEDGSKEPLEARHFVLAFGKYEGRSLDEVSDSGYLAWLLKTAKEEKKDWFQERCVLLRLKELE